MRHPSRPGAFCRWAAAGAVLWLAAGCREPASGKSPRPLELVVGKAASAPADPKQRNFTGTSPAAGTCSDMTQTACTGGCCAAGLSCSSTDNGCEEPTQGACPDSAPVACHAATTCTTGCSALDASPYGNAATLVAPAIYSDGKFGSGVQLGSVAGTACAPEVGAPTAGFPTGDEPMTLEGWFAFRDAAAEPLFTYGDEATGNARMLVVFSGVDLAWWKGTGASSCQPHLSQTIADGQWHFLAITYSQTNTGTVALYADGTPAGSCDHIGPLATPAGSTLEFGQYGVAAQENCTELPGLVDEVRVLNFAETSTQIAADFTGGPLSAITGTVGLWHFDEGTGLHCCPEGTTCATDGSCATPAGSGTPSDCPDGGASVCADNTCCPVGMTCTNDECAEGTPPVAVCPDSAPVDCNDGTCCPTGWSCDSGDCEQAPSGSPGASPCSPGATFTSGEICCPSVPADAGSPDYASALGAVCSVVPLVGCTTGSCPDGYTCETELLDGEPFGPDCFASDTPTDCADGGTLCTYGCCASDETCGSLGLCCPSDDPDCGCPSGSSLNGQSCEETSTAATCADASETLCGGVCCPADTQCESGQCIATQSYAAICPNADPLPCGSVCCPTGSNCVDGACEIATLTPGCDADHPVSCSNGDDSGGCCETGEMCLPDSTSATGSICWTADTSAHTGPQGNMCGEGFCETGDTCGDDTCCPSDEPVSCAVDVCCPEGTACDDGACGCPGDEIPCGDDCCGAGANCVDGTCESACDTPDDGVSCGDVCCMKDPGCGDASRSQCACAPEFPVPCGTTCCLEGATCETPGTCGCPQGEEECGDDCCGDDQVCDNGECVDAPSSSGGSCDGKCDGSGDCGACSTTDDCCEGAVCVSPEICSKNSVAPGCQCTSLSDVSSNATGRCLNYASAGLDVTVCGDCDSQTSWCCPGSVCVEGAVSPHCEETSSPDYDCPGM